MSDQSLVINNQQSEIKNRAYDHARHEPVRRALRWAIDNIAWRFLARIDQARISGLEHLPATGPAILMINHIAFIDPIVVLGNLPRNIVPMAKAEVKKYPKLVNGPMLEGDHDCISQTDIDVMFEPKAAGARA